MDRPGAALTALLFALTSLATAASADPTADPVYCGAMVAQVVPWDVARDAPGDGTPTRLYGFGLQADQAWTIGGTVEVATDTKIYTLPFSDLKFTPSTDVAGEFYSSNEMFALPIAAVVRYAWVTQVDDPLASTHTPCASLPLEVKALDADARAQMTQPITSSTPRSVDWYRPTDAVYVRDVPPLPCGAAYVPAVVVNMPETTDYWDTSQGRSAKPVYMRIDLGTDARVADVRIQKSSGSIPIDQSAADAAFRGQYKAATFLCAPAAAALEYQYDYSVQ
ncbi:MAG TPA: hypothetical protein VIJ12_04195 [Candidatus Baltobacteraceae bacterium]